MYLERYDSKCNGAYRILIASKVNVDNERIRYDKEHELQTTIDVINNAIGLI